MRFPLDFRLRQKVYRFVVAFSQIFKFIPPTHAHKLTTVIKYPAARVPRSDSSTINIFTTQSGLLEFRVKSRASEAKRAPITHQQSPPPLSGRRGTNIPYPVKRHSSGYWMHRETSVNMLRLIPVPIESWYTIEQQLLIV